jgi:hypothetical protein
MSGLSNAIINRMRKDFKFVGYDTLSAEVYYIKRSYIIDNITGEKIFTEATRTKMRINLAIQSREKRQQYGGVIQEQDMKAFFKHDIEIEKNDYIVYNDEKYIIDQVQYHNVNNSIIFKTADLKFYEGEI